MTEPAKDPQAGPGFVVLRAVGDGMGPEMGSAGQRLKLRIDPVGRIDPVRRP
jgi:hypothetical protein